MARRKKPAPVSEVCPSCGCDDPKKFRPVVNQSVKMGQKERYCPDPAHDLPKAPEAEAHKVIDSQPQTAVVAVPEIPAMEPWRPPPGPDLPRGTREALPARRAHYLQKFEVASGVRVHLDVGEYPGGRPGEIFVTLEMAEGAEYRSLMNCLSIVTSLALQHGTPLETLVDALVGIRFGHGGRVEAEGSAIQSCTSVVDLVFRELGITYLGRQDLAQAKPDPVA